MDAPSLPSQTLSPWLSIWIKPRETIRRIVDSDPSYRVLLLTALAGIGQALDRASTRNTGDDLSLPVILVICLVAGPIGSIISLYIGGALLRWIGSWFGGQASSEEVRAAMAWSSVPVILSYVLWIPELVLFGEEMFTSVTPRIEANPALAFLLLGFAVIQLILAVWSLVLLLKCLGEVHEFSAWKALAVILVAGLILFVPIFCIVALLSGFTYGP